MYPIFLILSVVCTLFLIICNAIEMAAIIIIIYLKRKKKKEEERNKARGDPPLLAIFAFQLIVMQACRMVTTVPTFCVAGEELEGLEGRVLGVGEGREWGR